MDNSDLAKWWIDTAITRGVGLVFTASVLGLLLWVAWTTVAILKQWLPKWIQIQIECRRQDSHNLNRLCYTIECIHVKNHAVYEGMRHNARAIATYLNKNKEQWHRLGIGSDVLVHLTNAIEALDVGPTHIHHAEVEGEQGDREAKPIIG